MQKLVRTREELDLAVRDASVDHIMLAPGNYGAPNWRNIGLDGTSRLIESEDKERMAVFSRSVLRGCSDIRFMDTIHEVILSPDEPRYLQAMTAYKSKNIHIEGGVTRGHADRNSGADDAYGIRFDDCEECSVARTELYELKLGISFNRGRKAMVRGCNLHNIRTDGVMVAGVDQSGIIANAFRDFFGLAGDHVDFIQYFPFAIRKADGTVASVLPCVDIHIEGNIGMSGVGGGAQGVFLRAGSAALADPRYWFRRVRIVNNLFYIGDTHNGISVLEGVEDLEISNNSVLSPQDDRYRLWIRVTNATGRILIERNVTDLLLLDASVPPESTIDNVELSKQPDKLAILPDIDKRSLATPGGLVMPGAGYQLPVSPVPEPAPADPCAEKLAALSAELDRERATHVETIGALHEASGKLQTAMDKLRATQIDLERTEALRQAQEAKLARIADVLDDAP